MTATRLRNILLKNTIERNKIRCTKQRNNDASLLRSAKNKYYGKLDEKKLIRKIISSSRKL